MKIIVNPAADGGRLGHEWPRIEKRLSECGLSAPAVFTEAPWHATELAAAAVAEGVQRVVVAGGDGTVCEAAEGLFGAGGGELAILPLGTGNDGARTLGVPTDLEAAARAATGGSSRSVDLITIGDHAVLNAVAGAPGSVFTLIGSGLAPNREVPLLINDVALSNTIRTTISGASR